MVCSNGRGAVTDDLFRSGLRLAEHAGTRPRVSHRIQDLSDDKVLAEILKSVGLDEGTTFARIAEQAIKDELKANTDEAVTRGAFGAPTFFVGDKMFFGNDRFDFVIEALHA